jgi:hypothetical protein
MVLGSSGSVSLSVSAVVSLSSVADSELSSVVTVLFLSPFYVLLGFIFSSTTYVSSTLASALFN